MLLGAIALASGLAHAGPFEGGLAAYRRGDQVAALQVWRSLAESGDSAAQTNIAVLYIDGKDVAADPAAPV